MRLFGTSGIRRIADCNLIQLALKVGLAVGGVYDSAVVGSDTRTTSSALKHALIAGVLAGGADCFDAGVLPVPTLALAARQFKVGVMITASHNPPEYNGIKLINPDGSAFDVVQRRQIEGLVFHTAVPQGEVGREGFLAAAPWSEISNSQVFDGAIANHAERVLRDFHGGLKLKVVVDCGCGAASHITPYVLTRLGCDVVAINCYPTGFFPRDIEPTEANLGDLMQATREFGADLGIAHDGDADRMMVVDDEGRFIPGDKLLVLLAEEVGASEVVTTIDTSMIVGEMGFRVIRTKVGDVYVSEALRGNGDFGGEPSGNWVFPAVSLCPDGVYAAVRMASIAGRQQLSRLVDEIPSYPLIRGSLSCEDTLMPKLEVGLMAMKPLRVDDTDGIKLGFSDGWLLIRASGTEPKIRVTVEAKSAARARKLYDSAVQIISDCKGRVD
jgi:phosphoglucosamine mutase